MSVTTYRAVIGTAERATAALGRGAATLRRWARMEREGDSVGRLLGIDRSGPSALAVTLFGLMAVLLIARVDFLVGPRISLGLFYLLPVAIAAWWAGFSYGILVALAASAAWKLVDDQHDVLDHPALILWNGLVRFLTLATVSLLLSRLHLSVRREKLAARTDALTGALNGRTFLAALVAEADRARHERRSLTLAYVDLDHFKEVNDRFGHACGNDALIAFIRVVRAGLRRSDLIGRLGGDEFALLLPGTDTGEAVLALTRLQRLLREDMVGHGWPITLSIGAATFRRAPADVELMIRRVDALMYGAKRGGKDRVNHEVVDEADSDVELTAPRSERRATARLLCNRSARVRSLEASGDPESFAVLTNISAGGVAIHSPERFPEQALLALEPSPPKGVRTLLAKVVRVTAEDGGWLHGCEVTPRLSVEELEHWLDGREGVVSL